MSIDAGDKAVELMKVWIDKARRPEMMGGIGGFAGLFDASALKAFDHPILATSADGVGTKVAIAQAMDIHHTIGFDLVGMLVDDLVVCGAEPLFLTDYIATGRVVPERVAAIVQGIAEACVQAGCALVGGETAEHPGLLGPDEYDVAGSTTGVVEAADLLGPGRVEAGDVVIAMASSGRPRRRCLDPSGASAFLQRNRADAQSEAGPAGERTCDPGWGGTAGELEVANADSFSFPVAAFDLVWTMESSEHFNDENAFSPGCTHPAAGRPVAPGGVDRLQSISRVREVGRAFLCPELWTQDQYQGGGINPRGCGCAAAKTSPPES